MRKGNGAGFGYPGQAGITKKNPLAQELKLYGQELEQIVREQGEELEKAYQQIKHEQTERQLADERFFTAFITAPIMLSINRVSDGSYLEVNDCWQKALGYNRAEALDSSAGEINIALNLAEWSDLVEEVARKEKIQDREFYFRTRTGEIRVGLLTMHPVFFKGEQCRLTAIADVTEARKIEEELRQKEKQAKAALKESRKNFRELFDNAIDMIFLAEVRENGLKLFEANSAACRNLKYTKSELLLLPAEALYAPEQRGNFSAMIGSLPFKRNISSETVLVAKDGTHILATINAHLFTLNQQQVALLIVRNIGKNREIENALQSSEERFVKAFKANPNAMAINKLADLSFVDVNDSFLSVTGYRREEVIGRSLAGLNLLAEEERNRAIQIISEKGSLRNMDSFIRARSGEILTGLFAAELIKVGEDQCILTIFTDMTDYNRIRKEMEKLERLNLIGEISASIGHEIRNPMTTIRGFLQLLREKKECIGFKEYFNLMIDELDRANSIISEFLALSKGKVISREKQNLSHIIRSLADLIAADATVSDKSLKVELNETPDLFLDGKEIRQLILNLSRNGLEAMAKGGCLTLKTFMDGAEAVLAVQDEGCGIPSSIVEKVGTPFFTTKEHGTGLGLAVCYSIASRHGATIHFDTGPQGTTFFVRFKTVS